MSMNVCLRWILILIALAVSYLLLVPTPSSISEILSTISLKKQAKSLISKLYIKKLVPEAQLPKKRTEGAAGYDLFSAEETVIPAMGKGKVKTGLSFMTPTNTYARIAPRSKLAWKNSIIVGAGVIDEDSRGEIFVILFNHGDTNFKIK